MRLTGRTAVVALALAVAAGGMALLFKDRMQPADRFRRADTITLDADLARSNPAPPQATKDSSALHLKLSALPRVNPAMSMTAGGRRPAGSLSTYPVVAAALLAAAPTIRPAASAATVAPAASAAATAPLRAADTAAGSVLAGLTGQTRVPAAIPTSAEGTRLLPLEVTVNGAKAGTAVFVERAGALYATRDVFEEWRLQLPGDAPSISHRGQTYFALSAVPGHRSRLDLANQSVELVFAPHAFAATRMTQEPAKRPVVSPVLPSAFLNYDINYSHAAQKGGPTLQSLGMLAEIGVSTSLGILTNSIAARNLNNAATLDNQPKWLRLETTFTRDYPEINRTLRLGDSRTRSGMLGRDVYFGGVQYGTNFALTPGFISQPLPTLRGLSASQSTVELYINDVLRQVSKVPSGPFTIDRLPGLTGGGEARLVVRDILGRETVIIQPFFTSSQLLATGLTDWQAQAGAIRRDLGSASSNYGAGFAGGTARHGYNDRLTIEATAAATPALRMGGIGMAMALPLGMLGRVGAAASRERTAGSGAELLLGIERQGERSHASLQLQGASINFRQLGQEAAITPVKQQLSANWTYTSVRAGTFGVGLASLSRYDSDRFATISGSYSIGIGAQSNLSITVSQALAGATGTSIGVNLIIPFGADKLISASAGRRNGASDFFVAATQNQTAENNLGWRALAGRQTAESRFEGGLYFTGTHGRLSGDISTSQNQTNTRLGATGALVLADRQLFATHRLDQSFALVEVKDHGGIGVGLGSTVLARTDATGIALVPRLSAYQNNFVRLNPQDLPVNAELDSIEQIAVPGWRSGVKVIFPVRSGRGALVKIVLDDGAPAPVGAVVQIVGDKAEFYVGRRGEAFVTGLEARTRLQLGWKDRQCRFEVALPAGTPDDIPRVGPLTCSGISR